MKKIFAITASLLFILCSCSTDTESIPQSLTVEVTEIFHTEQEPPFTETMEEIPQEHELFPADPLESLNIKPSDFFTPGVWTSTYTDDTGNFYIFDKDGIHGEIIPMSDAEGMGFSYSINGNKMTMYVGEELTPYNAELEKISEGHVIIHMTYLGTQDELVYLSGISAENFSFYPSKKLSVLAERYYMQQTGTELAGIECNIIENDMVVLNLYITDENGWRKDVESYTVSMFTASGWSSITCEPIDLRAAYEESDEPISQPAEDDIPDIFSDFTEESAQF